jgi:hypothetical protein
VQQSLGKGEEDCHTGAQGERSCSVEVLYVQLCNKAWERVQEITIGELKVLLSAEIGHSRLRRRTWTLNEPEKTGAVSS